MNVSRPQPPPHFRQWAESPWFWFFLFGSMALVAVAVIAPKYAVRQERLERMAAARVESDQWRNAGQMTPETTESRSEVAEEKFDDPQSMDPRIQLGTLALFVGLLMSAAAFVLGVVRRRQSMSAKGSTGRGQP